MKNNKKLIALVCTLLLMVGAVGATLAWLTDQSDPVTNTFTVGDINIELTETPNTDTDGDEDNDVWTGKVVPGTNLPKDPKVTVLAESEKCYLFVEVQEANWPQIKEVDGETLKVKYDIADGWNELTGVSGVYYRIVEMDDENQDFPVIEENTVYVSETLTKAEMETITNPFTVAFKAYAVQFENMDDELDAWAALF